MPEKLYTYTYGIYSIRIRYKILLGGKPNGLEYMWTDKPIEYTIPDAVHDISASTVLE
jgi:hypothetical protein